MAKGKRKVIRINKWAGRSQFDRVATQEGAFLRSTQLDYRTDPSSLQLNRDEVGASLPTTIDLVKWLAPGGLVTQSLFSLDASGYIKKRDVSGTYTDFSSHASSAGQGLGYWRGDDCLHFANYQQVGKLGPLDGATTYRPDWQVLESDDDYHPIREFRDFNAYGNGRYVATWDATTWDNDRLILPSGWRVRSLEVWNEYLAIGCWRGNKVDSDAKGILFFWDGISTTYNFFVETKGAVLAMKTVGSELRMLLGSRAELWKYNGALSKVERFPNIEPFGDYVDIYPGAVAEHKGMMMMGLAGDASLASFARGVYSHGSLHPGPPDTFNHEFLGAGNTTTAFDNTNQNRIGALGSIQNTLLFSTYHSTVTNLPVIVEIDGSSPFTITRGGRFESLVIDDGQPHRMKRALKFIANFSYIPATDVTLEFFYRKEDDSWVSLGSTSTVGDVEFEVTGDPLPFDFRSVQLACVFNQSATEPQVRLYSMLLEYEEEVPL